MAQFVDDDGRAWSFQFIVRDIPRLRARGLDLNLLFKGDIDAFLKLIDDRPIVVGILYEMLQPALTMHGIDAAQFDEMLIGPTFDAAQDALFAESATWTPRTIRGPMITAWNRFKAAADGLPIPGGD